MRPLTRFLVSLVCLGLLVTPAGALERGARAPEFQGRDRSGTMIESSNLRGKVVVVDFWASWCGPCREELPVLNRLYGQLRQQGLVVVGVNIDTSRSNMDRFLTRTPVAFPVIFDEGHQLARRFAPARMPSSYIIDRHGVVRYVHAGYESRDAAVIERELRALLAEH